MMQSEARLILRYFGALPKQVGNASKSTASTVKATAAPAVAATAARAATAVPDPARFISVPAASPGAADFHLATAGSPTVKQQGLSFAASGL
ncbi:hypothetical protein ABPG75_003832 [Micractinium tetrahymenae]